MRPWSAVARTSSARDTQDLAAALAGLCRAGDVLVLAGEMGAGKTAFAQGFARGLGVTEAVTSPTFTIVREYQGDELALHHLDVYRLDQLREVTELGIGEMLDEDAVMVVEWGDTVIPVLGEQYLEVSIGFVDPDDTEATDDQRRLAFAGVGVRWAARERVLGEAVAPWAETDDGSAPC